MNKLVTFLDERIIGPSSTAHEDEGDVNHETKSRKKRKIVRFFLSLFLTFVDKS